MVMFLFEEIPGLRPRFEVSMIPSAKVIVLRRSVCYSMAAA